MIAADNVHRANIRKAAILLASLDQDAADLLLEQLGPAQGDLVRRAAMELDETDEEERQRVFDEFRRISPMIPDASPPGIELDGPSVKNNRQLLQLIKASKKNDADELGSQPPFGFLRETEEEKLWQLLSTERPQTVALVLSHLSAERAGEVLSRFPPPRQAEVVRRLADLDKADPETLREVEQTLETRLSRQFAGGERRLGGPETVVRILDACDPNLVGGILDNLAEYDRTLAEQLGRREMDFDDLERLDDATLAKIFRAAEPEAAQAALLSASPRFVQRILRCMTPADAKIMRRKLDSPGPIRLSDLEEARRQVAALAQRMSHNGRRKNTLAA